MLAIKFAFHEALIASVHAAVQIALTSAGCPDKSVSTKLSDPSSVPGSNTNLSKDLVRSTLDRSSAASDVYMRQMVQNLQDLLRDLY